MINRYHDIMIYKIRRKVLLAFIVTLFLLNKKLTESHSSILQSYQKIHDINKDFARINKAELWIVSLRGGASRQHTSMVKDDYHFNRRKVNRNGNTYGNYHSSNNYQRLPTSSTRRGSKIISSKTLSQKKGDTYIDINSEVNSELNYDYYDEYSDEYGDEYLSYGDIYDKVSAMFSSSQLSSAGFSSTYDDEKAEKIISALFSVDSQPTSNTPKETTSGRESKLPPRSQQRYHQQQANKSSIITTTKSRNVSSLSSEDTMTRQNKRNRSTDENLNSRFENRQLKENGKFQNNQYSETNNNSNTNYMTSERQRRPPSTLNSNENYYDYNRVQKKQEMFGHSTSPLSGSNNNQRYSQKLERKNNVNSINQIQKEKATENKATGMTYGSAQTQVLPKKETGSFNRNPLYTTDSQPMYTQKTSATQQAFNYGNSSPMSPLYTRRNNFPSTRITDGTRISPNNSQIQGKGGLGLRSTVRDPTYISTKSKEIHQSTGTINKKVIRPPISQPTTMSLTTPWARAFILSRPKDALLPIPREFLADGFNLVRLAPIVERSASLYATSLLSTNAQSEKSKLSTKNTPYSHFSHSNTNSSFPLFKAGLRLILDEQSNKQEDYTDSIDDNSNKKPKKKKKDILSGVPTEIQFAAEIIYTLVHARYILSPRGLDTIRRMFLPQRSADIGKIVPIFGRCTRRQCRGMPLLPCGMTDNYHGYLEFLNKKPSNPDDMLYTTTPVEDEHLVSVRHKAKRYCPSCGEAFDMWESKVDGSAWGKSFCHMFLLTHGQEIFPALVNSNNKNSSASKLNLTVSQVRPNSSKRERNGLFHAEKGGLSAYKLTSENENNYNIIERRIFGFKIHPSAHVRYPLRDSLE